MWPIADIKGGKSFLLPIEDIFFPLKAIYSNQGICRTTILYEKSISFSPFSHLNTNTKYAVKEFEQIPSKGHLTINT